MTTFGRRVAWTQLRLAPSLVGAALIASLVFPSLALAAVAPTITSATNTSFTVGTAGTFTVTTTGDLPVTLSFTGLLPGGVTFTPDPATGTAIIAGTPAAGTGGVYSIVLTAANGTAPNATQDFTLTVIQNVAPAITSAASTTFAVGVLGSFTVTATGTPTPTVSMTGALPGGVTFTPNANGTATLAGTPAVGSNPSYTLTFTAANGVGSNATQTFTLAVSAGVAPAITSASGTTFVVGTPGTFTVTATGTPTPTLSMAGTLPSGVTFTPNANGTATLAGTPAVGTNGSYTRIITAANGVGSNATQSFTLTVAAGVAPTITSAASTTFAIGTANTFTVTATGSPVPILSRTGTLPSGVTFTANANGTATLAGTPAAGTAGTYLQVITAANGVGSNATQTFTLTVVAAGPSVTINQAATQADPTNASPINFTVIFSATVTGFATGDVTISGTAGGTRVGTVTGSGTTYNVAVTGMSTAGTVIATISAGVALDGSSRPNLASTSTDNTVTWSAPTGAITVTPSASTITWGGTVVLTTRFAANGANRTFQLWGARDNRNPANFALITTQTTNSSGIATFAYTPPTNLFYEARFAGASGIGAATSPQARVVVRQIALLRPTNSGATRTVNRGTTITFTTTVRPSRPELTPATVTFWVFRRVSGVWQQFTSRNVTASAAGLALFTWSFSTSGSWYVRSMANPTPFNANSVKSPVELYNVN
jgi:hypothetical protein